MLPLSKLSEERLATVHPHLQDMVRHVAAVSDFPFMVTEGVRTVERQKQLVKQGASRTMNSRHLTGHAIDLACMICTNGKDFEICWKWHLYETLADLMKKAAKDLGYALEWGGDWKTFKDGCHFQLPWEEYPIEQK